MPPDTVQYLEIAYDEPIRLARLKPGQVSLMQKYKVTESDAWNMCRAEGLLSPLYQYSHRGGCWFCPNASMSELRHLYHAHPDLWQLMMELQSTPNKATEKFNRSYTLWQLDEKFSLEGEQLSLFDSRDDYLNPAPFTETFGPLQTTEVVVTDERVLHIKQRHPEDYLLFEQYGRDTVLSPDILIQDVKNVGTVFAVKRLPETNLNVVLRLVLDTDNPNFKNSVMTYYRIREKNLKKLMDKNPVLYIKE